MLDVPLTFGELIGTSPALGSRDGRWRRRSQSAAHKNVSPPPHPFHPQEARAITPSLITLREPPPQEAASRPRVALLH